MTGERNRPLARPGEQPKPRPQGLEAKLPDGIGQIVSRLFQMRGYGRPQGDAELHKLWAEVAGPQIAGGTRVLGLKSGVLTIGVSSPPLMSELVAFHQDSLLEALQAKHGKRIKSLKFRRTTSR